MRIFKCYVFTGCMNTFFKNILFSGLIYTVFIQSACAGNTSSFKEVNPKSESIEEKGKFNFKSDSGYILSAEAFNFLISNALIDTISRKTKTIISNIVTDQQILRLLILHITATGIQLPLTL